MKPNFLSHLRRLAVTALRIGAGCASLTLLAGLPAPTARAQGTPPAGGAQQPPATQPPGALKIGVLHVRNAIVATAEGKQASATLQSQFTPRTNEIENMRKQLEDLQKRLSDGQRTLSDEEKGRLQRQGEALQRIFQRRQDDLREDVQAAENDVIETIGAKMMSVLDRYARENGFSVVFDVSAQTTPVLYATQGVNITQDIVRLYDQANPVTGAGAQPPAQKPPAQPGQQRPPAQPPAQRPPQ